MLLIQWSSSILTQHPTRIRIAKDIPYRISRKRGLRAGVSGQAPLESRYVLQVENFEIFRDKPRKNQEREF